jgi:prevent-host-death family protein
MMTKHAKARPRKKLVRSRSTRRGESAWMLHEAKARFSELVRLANTAGPQRVTVHGRNGIVVLSEEDYEKLKRTQPGTLLVDLMRNSPLRDVEFASPRVRSPVRDIEL